VIVGVLLLRVSNLIEEEEEKEDEKS